MEETQHDQGENFKQLLKSHVIGFDAILKQNHTGQEMLPSYMHPGKPIGLSEAISCSRYRGILP